MYKVFNKYVYKHQTHTICRIMKNIFKQEAAKHYYLISIVILSIQLLLILLFTKELISDLGLLAITLPVLLLALYAGALLKKKTAFILLFVWSIMVLLHSVTLILINVGFAYIIYALLASVQIWAVSQTRLGRPNINL